jgi:hypothetical protein
MNQRLSGFIEVVAPHARKGFEQGSGENFGNRYST